MGILAGSYVYMVFDQFQAIHLFEEAKRAVMYIEDEAQYALDPDEFRRRVNTLSAGTTVYPTGDNRKHEIRAVKTNIK
jgi:hypothetical protein